MEYNHNRRGFIKMSGLALGLASIGTVFPCTLKAKYFQEGEEEVGPAEDLMREHGVLKRVLIVYQEIIDRIQKKAEFSPNIVNHSAGIIKNFIEDYHEKLEEDYLFPRFKKTNTLTDLVEVLDTQHKKGREVTDKILKISKGNLKNEKDKNELKDYLYSFIRMYSPHEAREDTILFPAFRKLLSQKEYKELGDKFEDKEHDLFGKEGFESMVNKVADIEKQLGIYDLAKFTPQV